ALPFASPIDSARFRGWKNKTAGETRRALGSESAGRLVLWRRSALPRSRPSQVASIPRAAWVPLYSCSLCPLENCRQRGRREIAAPPPRVRYSVSRDEKIPRGQAPHGRPRRKLVDVAARVLARRVALGGENFVHVGVDQRRAAWRHQGAASGSCAGA